MSLLRYMSELAIAQSRLINTAGVTADEIITLNKLRAAAEHRLLSIRVLPPTNSPKNQLETAVYEACRLTALMCSNCIFRAFTPNGVVFRGLTQRLLNTLKDLEAIGDLDDTRDFEEVLLGFISSAG